MGQLDVIHRATTFVETFNDTENEEKKALRKRLGELVEEVEQVKSRLRISEEENSRLKDMLTRKRKFEVIQNPPWGV